MCTSHSALKFAAVARAPTNPVSSAVCKRAGGHLARARGQPHPDHPVTESRPVPSLPLPPPDASHSNPGVFSTASVGTGTRQSVVR